MKAVCLDMLLSQPQTLQKERSGESFTMETINESKTTNKQSTELMIQSRHNFVLLRHFASISAKEMLMERLAGKPQF